MIQTFVNEEFGTVRTLDNNGKVMFCGSDITKALGYRNSPDALLRHCKGIVKHDTLTNGGIQSISFIPEGDVYRLIAHSRLPAAERFEEWIFDEILPTIRRTGGYVGNEDMFVESYLPFADDAVKNLFRLNLMTIRQLNEKIRRDEPLVQFANRVADISYVVASQIRNSRLIQSYRPAVFFLSLKISRKSLIYKCFLLLWCISVLATSIFRVLETLKYRKALLPVKV